MLMESLSHLSSLNLHRAVGRARTDSLSSFVPDFARLQNCVFELGLLNCMVVGSLVLVFLDSWIFGLLHVESLDCRFDII